VPAWIAYLVHASAAAIAYGIFTVRRRSGDERALKVFEIATAVVLAGALLALTSGPILIDFYKAYLYAGNAVLSPLSFCWS